MYHRGTIKEEIKEVPFDVICTNCGSHDVTVTAYEHFDLGITCNTCGSYLSYGSYNPTTYRGD